MRAERYLDGGKSIDALSVRFVDFRLPSSRKDGWVGDLMMKWTFRRARSRVLDVVVRVQLLDPRMYSLLCHRSSHIGRRDVR